MSQGSFFDRDEDGFPRPETLRRNEDPDTSDHAANLLVRNGEINRMKRVALEHLRKHPGSTARELDKSFGQGDGMIRKRLNDLAKDGLARKGEKRKCQVSGRRAYPWFPSAFEGES